jgi:hypothetical protein
MCVQNTKKWCPESPRGIWYKILERTLKSNSGRQTHLTSYYKRESRKINAANYSPQPGNMLYQSSTEKNP